MSLKVTSAAYKTNNIGNLNDESLQPLAATDRGRLNNGAPSKLTSLVSYTNGNEADHNTVMITSSRSGKDFGTITTTATAGNFSYNKTEKVSGYTDDEAVARQNAITAIYKIGTKNVLSERNNTEDDKNNGSEGTSDVQ